MSNQNTWPFGHLNKDKGSQTAKELAIADLSKYGEEEVVTELKRYFLIRYIRKRKVTMESKVVDQAWHQFILDTYAYTNFCELVFGGYLHHHSDHYEPDQDFRGTYMELYGEELHSMWDNNSSYSQQTFNREKLSENHDDDNPGGFIDHNCA